MKRRLPVLLGLGLLAAVPLVAQEGGQAPAKDTQVKDNQATGTQAAEKTIHRAEEVTVESASKNETALIDAPATMSVVTSQQLQSSPAQNYVDLLRAIPGMNVIQTSARDFNLTTRQATSTLNNSQLVLVDGRSVYLDFFGLVLWDFVPSPTSGEIKQIEVVRGPASVVWGANAMTGVVNIITKSPRENQGFGLMLGAGLFNRDGGSRQADGDGYNYSGSFSYADAPNDKWSYKLSAGYFNSDPYSRPVGTVPLGCHPLGANPCRDASGNALPGGFPTGGAPYPTDGTGLGAWPNAGTSQPKVDLRLDQEISGGGRITYQGGYSGTDGIIHTGIGPFDIQSDSRIIYGRVQYQKGAFHLGAFGNFVDANAPNLLQYDPDTLQHVLLAFKTETYDVEVGNTNVVGGKHILTYGGNFRRNDFAITLAPDADNRNEYGAYFQEEYFVSKFRLAAGARVDKLGNLDKAVFSPRVSVMFKPTPDQSIRASYNRAFRAPSVINNYLDQNIIYAAQQIDLRPLAPLLPPPLQPLVPNEPFYLNVNTFGNTSLVEEHIDAFELAYMGTFGGKTTVGLAVYQNDTNNNINFTYLLPDQENPQGLPGLEYYSVTNPAKGVGVNSFTPISLSPILMGVLATIPPQYGGPILLPYKVATYLNLGPIRNRGFEASIQHRVNKNWSLSGNYSFQADPKVLTAASDQITYPLAEVEVQAKNRWNAAVSYNGDRYLANVDVNYVGRAFWNDVLTAPYFGFTDAYTMLNATLGVKLAEGKLMISLRGTNLTNEKILEHIYGDVIRRAVVAELRFFGK
jgi:outer membrane receptor protein involved in Fe transport